MKSADIAGIDEEKMKNIANASNNHQMCLAGSGAKRNDIDEQINQNGSDKVPETTSIEPKGCPKQPT